MYKGSELVPTAFIVIQYIGTQVETTKAGKFIISGFIKSLGLNNSGLWWLPIVQGTAVT